MTRWYALLSTLLLYTPTILFLLYLQREYTKNNLVLVEKTLKKGTTQTPHELMDHLLPLVRLAAKEAYRGL